MLECAEGHSILEVSRRLNVAADVVRTWGRRFIERGLEGLSDEPRPGARRSITDTDVERVIVKTRKGKPKNATHWSSRSMAAATGMSQSAVSPVWRAFALAPHRSQTFRVSTDPFFIDKVRDVVGVYLDPPERTLVLCVDEKSQIQAPDRSQSISESGHCRWGCEDSRRCAGRLFRCEDLEFRDTPDGYWAQPVTHSTLNVHPLHRGRAGVILNMCLRICRPVPMTIFRICGN